MAFAFGMADYFDRPDVFAMLNQMSPTEFTYWKAYFATKEDRRKNADMMDPDDFETSICSR